MALRAFFVGRSVVLRPKTLAGIPPQSILGTQSARLDIVGHHEAAKNRAYAVVLQIVAARN
jgi:hypothetical protein